MRTDLLLRECPAYRGLWFLVRAYHSVAAVMSRCFEEWGITGAQFGVLRCLADAGDEGLMLTDLSRRLMVTCGNTTGVVDRLEQAGYLRRQRQEDDRRVVVARLTPEGRAFFERIFPGYLEAVRATLEGLSPEEAEALAGCCQKLHETVERKRSDGA